MRRIRTLTHVIRLKSLKEEEIQMEINRINGEMDSCTDRLLKLEDDIGEAHELFIEKQEAGALCVEELSMYCDYFIEQSRRIKDEMKRIEEKREELESVRDTLIEVYKDKKLVENLRDRLTEEKKLEAKRKERKATDYIYVSQRNRK